jgi:REP element-mobilizing transposase RayT
MPRKARITVTGAIHHLMSRGNEGKPIFIDDSDRRFFLSVLSDLIAKNGYLLYAWCLMNNHYHLLVRINENPLGNFMRLLNGRYAQYFRKKSKTRGYLFQDRYKSIVTQDQFYIEEMVRYIHLNPIRAGICRSIRELDHFPWSGHSVLVDNQSLKAQNTTDVLKRFGREKKGAITEYLHFLEDGLKTEPDSYSAIRFANRGSENIHNTGSWVIGNRDFVAAALAAENVEKIRCSRHAKEGIVIEEIAKKVAREMGLADGEIMFRGKKNARSEARKKCAYILHRHYGLPVIRIAEFFNISSPAVSLMIREGGIRNDSIQIKI